MKQLSIFFMLIFSFSIFFISCDSGSSSSSLSDEEVAGIAESVFDSSEMADSFYQTYEGISTTGEYKYSDGKLIITVTESSFTFNFDNYGTDFDGDGNDDLTIDGAFSYADDGTTITVTYTAFSFVTTKGSASLSGSISVDSSSMSVDLTLSGTGYNSVIVTMDATMSKGTISSITEAIINGTDYSSEFKAALADYNAD